MKFGEYLARHLCPEWQAHYMNYEELKAQLKTPTFGPQEEVTFIDTLEAELAKATLFRTLKITELTDACHRVERAITSPRRHSVNGEKAFLESAEKELKSLVDSVMRLSTFVRLNYTAALKILKKHDKYTPFKIKPVFVVRLGAREFDKDHLEPTIMRLSAVYDALRKRAAGESLDAKKATANAAGGDFVRRTTKYWVHPDNITTLKCLILQHLPVLVHAENPSPAITSIYLDDPDFSLYHERMSKSEGAEAIRIRFYGPEPSPSSTIYVERKTHHEDWTGLESVKARFGVKEKYAQQVLSGTFDVEKGFKKLRKNAKEKGDEKGLREVEKAEVLAREVQESIRKRNLQPMVRTFYNRTAFQIPGNANVRISLDTDLHMVREDNEGVDRRKGGWMRPDCGVLAPLGGGRLKAEDVCVFPYAILEVKIQTHEGVEAPEWIQRLVESNLVEAVPKFSKFGHGVATLRSENISLLPYWLVQMENDIRGPTPGYEAPRTLPPNAPAPYLPPINTDPCSDLKGAVDSVVVTYTSSNNHTKPERHSEGSVPSKQGSDKSDSSHTIIVVDPYATNEDKIAVDDVPAKARGGSWWRKGSGSTAEKSGSGSGSERSLPNKNYWKKDKRIAVPVRIDPKLYMQNERTFLQWMKLALLSAAVGTGLVNFLAGTNSTLHAFGIFVTMASIFFIVIGYGLYMWRGRKIKARDGGHYDSILAVTFVCLVLIAALGMNVHFMFISGLGISR
ncbi:vacuolar transporter chaperone [Rhizophlyctis rosea]|uniref:Vacuolar transporter chaperone n=1 Tax=Rhizophlyctis rosea TaxID=64517 RepID=A0AAD5S5Q6_9FUNG|nr:vacuolar transporter chaperone [Rhizophlyctis rosea]